MQSFYRTIGPTSQIYDLTTVEAINAELGLTDNTTSDDAILQTQITSASKVIAALCDRTFALQEGEQTWLVEIGGEKIDRLNLKQWPLVELTSFTSGGVEVDATGYRLDMEAGLILRKREFGWWGWGWGWTGGEIIAQYTSGYDLPNEAPATLARACIELVKVQRFMSRRDTSIRDVSHGDTRVSFWYGTRGTDVMSAVPPIVSDMLYQYKRQQV